MTAARTREETEAVRYETLVDVLRFRAERHGADVGYRFLPSDGAEAQPITFSELDARARAVAARLEEVAAPGDRAILLYQPGLDYIAAYFGCIYAGIVAVPAYPPHPRRPDPRVPSILADSGAIVGLTTQALFSRLEKWRAGDSALAHLRWLATDDVPGGAGDTWRPPAIGADTVAMLQYTSGSTSTPKGVVITHENLLHNLEMVRRAFGASVGDLGVFWLPPFHDMGLIGGILAPCYTGVPVVLMPPATFLHRPLSWLQAISEYRATTSGAPNFAYDLCVDRIAEDDRAALDLSSWHTAFNGAEPVRAETLERFERAFAPAGFRRRAFFPCYGLAEATLIVSGGPVDSPPKVVPASRDALQHNRITAPREDDDALSLVACGQPAPGVTVRIVDPARRELCRDGHVGEIWVSGPNVACGYWGREQEESAFGVALPGDRRRYLRTGDLGVMYEGQVVVTGRLKDLIVIDGRNYYPQDLELVAERSHPDLLPAHAVAFSIDDRGRERLVLVLEVTRHHDPANADAVMAAVRSAVGEQCGILPERIALLRQNGLPRTSSGKVQRRATRDAYLGGALDVATEWSGKATAPPRANGNGRHVVTLDRDSLRAWICEWASRELDVPVHEVDAGRSLRDYGVDSLMAVRFVVAVETDLGLRIDASVLWASASIDALATELSSGARTKHAPGHGAPNDGSGYPEFDLLRSRFDELESNGLRNPYFVAHDGRTGGTARIAGRELVNFANYNYLGLSGHPAVNAAAQDAIARYGTSVSASRVVSGERPVHRELEHAIAAFLGAEDATVFVGGHATNVTTIAHLLTAGDLVCCDELVHNSAAQGAQFSGARVLNFPHNDWRALDRLLGAVRGSYRRTLVVIEGVYSADGDIPDLVGFVDVKRRHRALLMVDEAHSLGVLGATGRGIAEHFGVDPTAVDLWMGTLSKSLASCGGYIAGGRQLTEYLRYTAPGFVFSVGMTPPNAAAALAALRVLQAEPERVHRLQQNGRQFLELARRAGIHTGTSGGTPVIPAIIGDSMLAIRASQLLFDRGINVQPMVAPAVPNDKARLRFFVSTEHTEAQIRDTIRVLAEVLGECDRDPVERRSASLALP